MHVLIPTTIIILMVWMIIESHEMLSKPFGGLKEFYKQYWLSLKILGAMALYDLKYLFTKEK
jgi:hypothetical protein